MRLFKGSLCDANEDVDIGVLRLFCLALEARGDDYGDNELYISMIKRFPKDSLNKKLKRKCGDVIQNGHMIYMISQLLPGDPKHYDSEENRLDTFKLCLSQLEILIAKLKVDNPDIKKIQLAIPYLLGTSCKENWKLRKKLLVSFEKKTGVEFIAFVDPEYIESQKDVDTNTT